MIFGTVVITEITHFSGPKAGRVFGFSICHRYKLPAVDSNILRSGASNDSNQSLLVILKRDINKP